MNVADWLRMLDLGRYEAIFRENDASAVVLLGQTAEDPGHLCITSVGHSHQLLNRTATLRGNGELADDLTINRVGPAYNRTHLSGSLLKVVRSQ
jgi:hypothetical protein